MNTLRILMCFNIEDKLLTHGIVASAVIVDIIIMKAINVLV